VAALGYSSVVELLPGICKPRICSPVEREKAAATGQKKSKKKHAQRGQQRKVGSEDGQRGISWVKSYPRLSNSLSLICDKGVRPR
jgi:hypothetical protein